MHDCPPRPEIWGTRPPVPSSEYATALPPAHTGGYCAAEDISDERRHPVRWSPAHSGFVVRTFGLNNQKPKTHHCGHSLLPPC